MRVLAAMLILLAAACADAQAASPVQDYLAARDAYVTQFKDSDIIGDEAARVAHERALGDLETRLRGIVGPTRIAEFPDSKINLDSLAQGFEGYGLLDGLVYSAPDQKPQVVVATDELLGKWLAAHRRWWDGKDDISPGPEAALKSESFYSQALNTDAHFYKFGDIPLAMPASATFVYATLVGRAQDVGLQTPNEIVVTLRRGGRLFVVTAPSAATVTAAPTCAQGWNRTEKQTASAGADKEEALRESGYDAYRRCFAAQVPRQSYFAAVVKQAQGLIDVVAQK